MDVSSGMLYGAKQVETSQVSLLLYKTGLDLSRSQRCNIQAASVRMIRRENKILKDLSHDNIVHFCGFEETPERLTMQVLTRRFHLLRLTYRLFLAA